MSASANQQALEPFSIPVSSPLATTLNPDWYAIDRKWLKPLPLSICAISTHRVFGAIWRDWGLALFERRDKLKPLPLSICAISTHRVFGGSKAGGAA